jgi:hypothetical protein
MQYANPVTQLGAMQLNDIATKGYGAAPDPSMVMMQNALKRAQGGNVVTGEDTVARRYTKQPKNNAANDAGSTYQAARGSNDYSWGKVSPRFQNNGAELEPQGHGETKRRSGTTEDYLPPAQRRAYEAHERFRRGGAAKVTPAWQDLPAHVTQRLKVGSGAPRIHVEHSGEGLVLNLHLSPVGDHALNLSHTGGVNADWVRNAASHALHADARPVPFRSMPAPQVGAQAAPAGGFGQVIGQNPADTPGIGAWNAEGVKTLRNMR